MLMSIGFVLVAVLGSYLFNEIRRVKNELARIRAGHLLHLLKKGVIGEVWSDCSVRGVANGLSFNSGEPAGPGNPVPEEVSLFLAGWQAHWGYGSPARVYGYLLQYGDAQKIFSANRHYITVKYATYPQA